MPTAPSIARQRLIELLRLTPDAHMREGYVMALLNAVDEYVQAIQEKGTSRRYSTTDTGLAVDAFKSLE